MDVGDLFPSLPCEGSQLSPGRDEGLEDISSS